MRKTVKIASLIIAAALLICGIVGINASADEANLEIESANVAYNDMMHLAFTLTGEEALPDGAEAGIIIWNGEKDEYTVANASYKTFDASVDGTTSYYKSYGIAAPEIGKEIYVAACYKQGDAVTITETPFKYSIVGYFATRFTESITATQEELYANVLIYGAASNTVIDDTNAYTLVYAKGGYVGTYNRPVGVAKNAESSFMLRAQAVNANGDYFTKWVDAEGNTVSTERVCTVIPGKSGIVAYTAVYGDAAEADIDFAIGFEDYALGQLDVGTPDLTQLPTAGSYNTGSGTNYKLWFTNVSYNDHLTVLTYFSPVVTKNDTDVAAEKYTYTTDADGNYMINTFDKLTVTENNKGDNALSLTRDIIDNGVTITAKNLSTENSSTAEVDITYNSFKGNHVQYHVSIAVTDGTNKVTYRCNLYDDSANKNAYVYAEQANAGNYSSRAALDEEGNIAYLDHTAGETFTFKASFTTKTVDEAEIAVIEVYMNGEYFGYMPLTNFSAHKEALDLSNITITSLSVIGITAARDDITIDNVTFK